MRIAIRADGVRLPRVLRERVTRRVGYALARFGEHIGRVTARLWFSRPPTASGLKRCQIEVELKLPKTIKAETSHSEMLEAVDRAAGRLGRSIARALTVNQTALASPGASDPRPALRRPEKRTKESKPAHVASRTRTATAHVVRLRRASAIPVGP